MERGSDKHSPRVDEAITRDVAGLVTSGHEGHVEEFREQEGPDTDAGEATPDVLLRSGDTRGPGGFSLSHDDVETRTEIARHVQPSIFPARPDAIVESAVREHAPEWVVDLLSTLPDGLYDHFEAVWEALGGREDYPRS